MRTPFVCLLLAGGAAAGCSDPPAVAEPLPELEWTGADEAPAELGWATEIAGPAEDGERLVVSGVVYGPDGTTPAPGVLLYFYHTNAQGIYPKRGDETGNGRRHGYLRSWLRTNERGEYRITTIRPAPYPGRTEPAHIHMTVQPPGRTESWIDNIEFDDDPLVTAVYRRDRDNLGGSGIVTLSRNAEGVLRATRDIVLEP